MGRQTTLKWFSHGHGQGGEEIKREVGGDCEPQHAQLIVLSTS